MKGKKHWLTLKHNTDMRAFRLDKKNYDMIIAELEAKTSQRAQRIVD